MPESRDVLERVFREEAGVVQGALFAQLHDLDWSTRSRTRCRGAYTGRARACRAGRARGYTAAGARRSTAAPPRDAARQAGALALEHELAGAPGRHGRRGDSRRAAAADRHLRHPELARQAQVALTLRTLGGLTTSEIARAFLVDESAMARRLVRAKARLREAGVAYQVPPLEQVAPRRESVLAVLYLIFNEGYAATAGDALVRRELCAEAIRLARVLAELLPGDTEVRGLWALMLLHDARRDARVGADGVAIALESRPRRWDRAQIEAGSRCCGARYPAPRRAYELQARIGALHVAGALDTDWRGIVALYDRLLALEPSPVVALNRAIAVGLAEGAAAGLALLEAPELAAALADYAPFSTARADLLRRAGRTAEAREAYREAIERAGTLPERAFLEKRLEGLHA
jgi:RNA polymerase sigma-70 factor (ECF subfamily)